MQDLTERFMQLFDGSPLARGTDQGGCVREQVTIDHYARHLEGAEPLGVYPMVWSDIGWVVRWGCSDIDIDDERLAWNLHVALQALDIVSWVERSRSRGFHVWVFAEDWVPARTMRRALLVAHEVAGIPAKEVNPKQESLDEGQLGNYVRCVFPGSLGECRTLEQGESGLAWRAPRGRGQFLPSQGQVSSHLTTNDGPGYGSAGDGDRQPEASFHPPRSPFGAGDGQARVHRARYLDVASAMFCVCCGLDVGGVPVGWRATERGDTPFPRQVVITASEEAQSALCVHCFVERALALRTPTSVLEKAAALWREPAPKLAVQMVRADADHRALLNRMGRKAAAIYHNGPLADGDRSGALYRLAGHLKDQGYKPGETFEVLRFCPWNKFAERRDGEQRLEELVQSVYG